MVNLTSQLPTHWPSGVDPILGPFSPESDALTIQPPTGQGMAVSPGSKRGFGKAGTWNICTRFNKISIGTLPPLI